MPNVCRTCGFSDCPGARGGDCPRWPARDTSDLDTLTLDELYALHTRLCAEIAAISDRLLDSDNKPRIPVFSGQWCVLSAKQAEVWETSEAAMVEITCRELGVITDA